MPVKASHIINCLKIQSFKKSINSENLETIQSINRKFLYLYAILLNWLSRISMFAKKIAFNSWA